MRHDPRWRLLPGEVVADGVDHLAIGPAGVFALSCTGAASVEVVGERLTAATGIPVRAHLVVVAADAAGEAGPATVVRRERLRSFLHTRPERLAPVTVEKLHAAARDAGTWGPAPA